MRRDVAEPERTSTASRPPSDARASGTGGAPPRTVPRETPARQPRDERGVQPREGRGSRASTARAWASSPSTRANAHTDALVPGQGVGRVPDDRGARHEVVDPQRRAEAHGAARGQDVRGAGQVVAHRLGRRRPQERRARVVDVREHASGSATCRARCSPARRSATAAMRSRVCATSAAPFAERGPRDGRLREGRRAGSRARGGRRRPSGRRSRRAAGTPPRRARPARGGRPR